MTHLIRDDAVANTKESAIGCFVAGTLVHTKEGLLPIEQIKTGDWVLSKPESGEGEIAYKRVVNTFEFDDKEVWYVSYALTEKPREGEERIGFVVVTGNHPFWVTEIEEWALEGNETANSNCWMRADRLRPGMSLRLSDGRPAMVDAARKLVRMAIPDMGWMPRDYGGFEAGKLLDLRGGSPKYCRGPVGGTPPLYPEDIEGYGKKYDDLYLNEGVNWQDQGDDIWLKCKVYNFEVVDHHTYFVDKLGVWVHNTNCGSEKLNDGDTPEIRDQSKQRGQVLQCNFSPQQNPSSVQPVATRLGVVFDKAQRGILTRKR